MHSDIYSQKKFIEQCDDIALLSDILDMRALRLPAFIVHKSSTETQDLFNQIVNW